MPAGAPYNPNAPIEEITKDVTLLNTQLKQVIADYECHTSGAYTGPVFFSTLKKTLETETDKKKKQDAFNILKGMLDRWLIGIANMEAQMRVYYTEHNVQYFVRSDPTWAYGGPDVMSGLKPLPKDFNWQTQDWDKVRKEFIAWSWVEFRKLEANVEAEMKWCQEHDPSKKT